MDRRIIILKRILVIDDEPTVLLFLKLVLEARGYEVVEATNGEDGMQLFNESCFDLVIIDMIMPIKDGLKTITEIVDKTPEFPVIAISGGGVVPKERYLTVASYLGNVWTIPKPFSRELIADTVHELIGASGCNQRLVRQ